MRTQGILLVRDAVSVLNSHSTDSKTNFNVSLGLQLIPTPSGTGMASGRRESRRRLVLALDRFSNALMGNLQRFIEVDDNRGAWTIWTCCVTCLGHLAALCHLVSQTESTLSGSMEDLYDVTLDKLANLARKVHIEEYSQFDVLTGVRISVVVPGKEDTDKEW